MSSGLEWEESYSDAGADVIGINNRDLSTFEVDLATTERLRPLAGDGVLIIMQNGYASATGQQYLPSSSARRQGAAPGMGDNPPNPRPCCPGTSRSWQHCTTPTGRWPRKWRNA